MILDANNADMVECLYNCGFNIDARNDFIDPKKNALYYAIDNLVKEINRRDKNEEVGRLRNLIISLVKYGAKETQEVKNLVRENPNIDDIIMMGKVLSEDVVKEKPDSKELKKLVSPKEIKQFQITNKVNDKTN